jgi:hypothetical protein
MKTRTEQHRIPKESLEAIWITLWQDPIQSLAKIHNCIVFSELFKSTVRRVENSYTNFGTS